MSYCIAKYIRLSVDDGITDSLSIPHQHLLLDQHIDDLEIPNAEILNFVDNGFTGTNMERPALQEMLELVRLGRINCIIIKDFTRFARNSLESGYYIEQVFPLYRVRFISLGDYFDSNDYKDGTGGIDVAFKFLMGEYYSKDLSKKVGSVKRMQMLRGESVADRAIYGYLKNSDGKWEHDPKTAHIVKDMFKLALDGFTTAQIRDKFYEAKYPTPSECLNMKYGRPVEIKCLWTARMIRHMLDNIQYTGVYVSGKQESKAIGSSSKKYTDPWEWIVIQDKHPIIVSKEDFEKIKEIKSKLKNSITTKPLKSDMTHPKRGRMVSGDYVSSTPIYGYKKLENGKWGIDEAVVEVVKEMFQLAKEGLSAFEISEKLTEKGYLIPQEHIKENRGLKAERNKSWTAKSVRSILKNIQYTGTYVSGKILKDYDKNKSYHTPESEWIIIPDKHPAIVDKTFFDKVQEIIANSRVRRKNVRSLDYLLKGKIVCGCCGYALAYDNSTRRTVYRCYNGVSAPSSECYKLKTDACELEEAVMIIIKKRAELVLENGDLSKLQKKGVTENQIAECEKQIKQWVEKRQNCYEQFVLKDIDQDAYVVQKNKYTDEVNILNNRLSLLKQAERDKQADKKAEMVAKAVLSQTATPKDIVNALIEKVYFFPNDEVKIKWKFVNFADEV